MLGSVLASIFSEACDVVELFSPDKPSLPINNASYVYCRPNPVDPKKSSLQGVEKEMVGRMEGCEGAGEDECLVRRTLAAHTDYIYTQEHH
ncbi:hypothetical protein OPV22_032983 [Ensete ventricosum]|uniref:Phytosulfokine n=1 Tax=Ensete ventricosum TaxID=4639 RepID=A0AAV8PWX9_ENSVE|nr:hypothetical protein OPV22_032983 [Ensete ventricosum]